MKEKSINSWMHSIMLEIAITALVLMAGCDNVQLGSIAEAVGTVEIKIGENYTLPLSEKVNLDMIWIEPGTFMMGSPENELGRHSSETQHQVTLTKGYWLGKYVVTQDQYKAIIRTNPSEFQGADLPVERVSWFDAKKFCAKLTEIAKIAERLPEGYEYTLPTEAQWEYACRAGTTTAFNNGKNILTRKQEDVYYLDDNLSICKGEPCPNLDLVAWYCFNSDNMSHSVGQKLPNAWGLYDMHGNIWEWCLDSCDWNDDKIVADTYEDGIKDPLCTTGSLRMLRGGCWGISANGCRSAYRSYDTPGIRYRTIGFRVALVPIR